MQSESQNIAIDIEEDSHLHTMSQHLFQEDQHQNPSRSSKPYTDDEKQGQDDEDRLSVTPQLRRFQSNGVDFNSIELKAKFERILRQPNRFEVSSDKYLEFKIQGKAFKIRQRVSYSSDAKNKDDPQIWFVDTVSPGSPKMLHESLMDPVYRMQWESHLSSFRVIQIDEEHPNIHLVHSSGRPSAKGLISPRDFVDLQSIHKFEDKATGRKSVMTVLKSVERADIPEQKGFVRGNVMIRGLLFETLTKEEIQRKKLPKLMVAAKGDKNQGNEQNENMKEFQWTRIRYILQLDLGGRIPKWVTKTVMSASTKGLINDLRDFVMEKRLGLHQTDE